MKLKEFLNEKDIVGADKIYTKEEILRKIGFNKFKKLEYENYEVWGDFEGNPNDFFVKIKILHGNFNCKVKKLITLKGCPEIIDGDFFCSYNNLKTLEGGPKIVIGDYYCDHNLLKSLKGWAKEIGGNFDCSWNKKLTSLIGGPKIVKGDYICQFNGFLKKDIKSICDVEGEIKV